MLISIVVPCRNEADNLQGLVAEIAEAMRDREYEIVIVDDGSTDRTQAVLADLKSRNEVRPLRVIVHDKPAGQSAAIRSGLHASRGEIVATLDGDGQNDPAYLPALVDMLVSGDPCTGMVAGQRLRRTDGIAKIAASRFANWLRQTVLKDGARDSACGIKAVYRNVFLSLPFFDGWHRFMPALVRREAREVLFLDVTDRPRMSGRSNYGILGRGLRGTVDLFGVCWLLRRGKTVPVAVEKDA